MLQRPQALDQQLRTRRTLAAGLVAAIVLLAIAVPAALSRDEDEAPTTTATPTTVRRTTSSTSGRATSTTSSPSAATTAPSGTSGTTGTTIAPGGATNTTPAPPGTEAPAGTSTTTTLPPTRCGPEAFGVETVTDTGSYQRSDEVKIRSTLTKTSSAPCLLSSHNFVWRVENEAGGVVSDDASISREAAGALQPGQRITVNPTWDPLTCNQVGACTRAPAGAYTVVARWEVSSPPPAVTRTTFRIEG
jgi:hypothetical protein